jgi:hypothetical protein
VGWSNLHSGPVGKIRKNTDILSTSRLARGVQGMRRTICEDPALPFGTPSLLHSDLEVWPDERDDKVSIYNVQKHKVINLCGFGVNIVYPHLPVNEKFICDAYKNKQTIK